MRKLHGKKPHPSLLRGWVHPRATARVHVPGLDAPWASSIGRYSQSISPEPLLPYTVWAPDRGEGDEGSWGSGGSGGRGLTKPTLISHNFGSWEVQDQGARRFGAQTATFSLCLNMVGGTRELWGEGSLLPPQKHHSHSHDLLTSRRPHLHIPSYWGLGFNS